MHHFLFYPQNLYHFNLEYMHFLFLNSGTPLRCRIKTKKTLSDLYKFSGSFFRLPQDDFRFLSLTNLMFDIEYQYC